MSDAEEKSELRQVIADLVEELRRAPSGSRAPSEADIIARFGLSRSRARTVIQLLERNHLVHRVQGAGTFVTRQLEYPVSHQHPPSLHAIARAAGSQARTIRIGQTSAPAPPDIAAGLGIEEGTPITVLQRIGYIDDALSTYLEEYLPPGVVETIDVALNVIESVEELLHACGFDPFRARCRGTTVIPPAHAGERLELAPAVQTWHLETVVGNRADGRRLLMSRSWSRMDVIRIVFELGD